MFKEFIRKCLTKYPFMVLCLFFGMLLFMCMSVTECARHSPKYRIMVEGVEQGLSNDSIIKNYYRQQELK